MVKSDWTYHRYRQHNNLAWRVGDTPLVKALLIAFDSVSKIWNFLEFGRSRHGNAHLICTVQIAKTVIL